MEGHAARLRELGPDGVRAEAGCRVALAEDGIFILPEGREPVYLYYSDVDRLSDEGFQLSLHTWDGFTYVLSRLGGYYGEFLQRLRKKREAQLIRNLLMLDVDYQKEFSGAYRLEVPGGGASEDTQARLVLYRNSMVVFPGRNDPFNLNYCDLESMAFHPETYSLAIEFDLGERLVLTRLGKRFGELQQDLNRLIDLMYERTALLLAASFPPGTAEGLLLRLARALRRGKATSRARIEAVEGGLWEKLQGIIFTDEGGQASPARRKAFEFLAARAGPEFCYLGLRESFTSTEEDLKPVYWFLVALPGHNVIASEVTNESGHATYFFRIDEQRSPGPERTARRVSQINRAMQALNFRREVIYAREEQLASDRFARYRVALRKLPYLREVRQAFLGRAAHTSEAAWERRVEAILAGSSDPAEESGTGEVVEQ